jgi:hypothetical protein
MKYIFSAILLLTAAGLQAQVRSVPSIVKETFQAQYPGAEEVSYEDNLVSVQVNFTLNGEKMVASYTNKGRWKETEKDWSFEKLSEDVKTGFDKSKYADWEILQTRIVYRAGGAELYKVKVEKNDLQKKNLFFNKKGRLVEDSLTI